MPQFQTCPFSRRPHDVCHQTFGSRTAFKLVWCEGSRLAVILDDRAKILNIGEPLQVDEVVGFAEGRHEEMENSWCAVPLSLAALCPSPQPAPPLLKRSPSMIPDTLHSSLHWRAPPPAELRFVALAVRRSVLMSGKDKAWVDARRKACETAEELHERAKALGAL